MDGNGDKAAGAPADAPPGTSSAARSQGDEPAPAWLHELGAADRRGFFVVLGDHALQYVDRGAGTLYVSFDNLSSARDGKRLRDAWGYDFARKHGWSHLGVTAFRAGWFRDADLIARLQGLAAEGFLARFGRVILSGASMGGYAACAFAPLAPGCTVVAFSPQSTLCPERAPWDRRYPTGALQDWSGAFADAAEGIHAAGRAFLLYDPTVPEDARHAARLAGPQTVMLRARHSGHFTAQFLRKIRILSRVVLSCADGTLTEARFYALYRSARTYRQYQENLSETAAARWRPGLRRRLVRVLQGLNRPVLAHKVRQSLTEPEVPR